MTHHFAPWSAIVAAISFSSVALADAQSATELAAVAAQCGYQSPNTVPDHWIAVGVMGSQSQNCFTYVPPHFQASYFGEGGNIFAENPNLNAHILNGNPTGIQSCSAQGYAQWFAGFLVAMGSCTQVSIDWFREESINVGGQQSPVARFIYSCQRENVAQVGGLSAVVSPSVMGLCSTSAAGYFLPRDSIASRTCELSQIVNSVKCANPAQGGKICHKPICSTQCRQNGFVNGGFCNSFEDCVCHSN